MEVGKDFRHVVPVEGVVVVALMGPILAVPVPCAERRELRDCLGHLVTARCEHDWSKDLRNLTPAGEMMSSLMKSGLNWS